MDELLKQLREINSELPKWKFSPAPQQEQVPIWDQKINIFGLELKMVEWAAIFIGAIILIQLFK